VSNKSRLSVSPSINGAKGKVRKYTPPSVTPYIDPVTLPRKYLPTGQPIPGNFTDEEVRMFAERTPQPISYHVKMEMETRADFFETYRPSKRRR
jgi:hypothetical protein